MSLEIKCPSCKDGSLNQTATQNILECGSCGAKIRKKVMPRSNNMLETPPNEEKQSPPLAKILYGVAIAVSLIGVMLLILGPWDGNRASELQKKASDIEAKIKTTNEENDKLLIRIESAKRDLNKLDIDISNEKKEVDALDRQLTQNRLSHQRQLESLQNDLKTLSSSEERVKLKLEKEAIPSQVEMVKRISDATVVIRTDVGAGSGFIFDKSGLVMTNYHVIQLSSKIDVAVRIPGGQKTILLENVVIKSVDPIIDLAVLQLPSAPKEVSEDGNYPILTIREKLPSAGEPVVVIGSPGFSSDLLEYTVTKGIVSNNRREINGISLIQTTAAINSGNSGGPMVDERGQVIGVVTLKGIGVEGVGFALTTSMANRVINKQSKTTYDITKGLAEWEKEHSPSDALSRIQLQFRPKLEISFDHPVTEMHLIDGYILLTQKDVGVIQKFNLKENKLDGSCSLNSVITSVCLDDYQKYMYAISPELRQVYRVNVKTMKMEEQSAIAAPHTHIVYLGGRERFLIAYSKFNPTTIPFLLAGTSISEKQMKSFDFGFVRNLAAADGDGKYMFLVRQDQVATQLEVLPRSKMSKILDKLTTIIGYAASAKPNEQMQLNKATSELNAEYTKSIITLKLSNQVLAAQNNILPLVHSVGRTDVLFGRTTYRIRNNDLSEIGKLENNPDQDILSSFAGRDQLIVKLIDTIFAVSSDGKYAASGLHIYDLKTMKPVKRLPALSSLVVFSENNKDLYVYDEGRQSLLVIVDWLNSLPALK